MIFIGLRDDLGIEPSHPRAQTHPITVRDALVGVPDDSEAFTVKPTTNIYRDMLHVAPGRSQPGHHSHIRLPLNRCSPTILADAGFGHYHYWHPTEQRVLTFQELRRFASFPDSFHLVGTPGEKWSRIGNSVPPLFMKAIAEHVHSLLDQADGRKAVRDGAPVEVHA